MGEVIVIDEKNPFSLRDKITKSNELIEATYKLSLQEQRLLIIAASKVQPQDDELKAYVFRAADFYEIFDNNVDSGFYHKLKGVVRGLQSQQLTIKNTEGKEITYNWVIKSTYDDKTAVISLQFHPDLKNFFLEIGKRFTSYQLENVVKLHSSYSVRMYELLKRYEFQKTVVLKIDEIRNLLGIDPSKYKQYGHLKAKVLNISKREINNETDINFNFNEMKTGRKVTKLEFIIKKAKRDYEKPSQQDTDPPISIIGQLSFSNFPNDENHKKKHLVEQLINLDVEKDKLEWLLNEFSTDQINRNIEYVLERKKISNITYTGPYTIKAILKDYANSLDTSYDSSEQISNNPIEQAVEELIEKFVPKQKTKKVEKIPSWLYKEQALKIFKQYMHEQEAIELWEGRKKEVLKEIEKRTEKRIIRN